MSRVGRRGTRPQRLAGELSRRDFLARAGALGLGATIAAALPYAARMAVARPGARRGPDRRHPAGVLRHDRPRQAGPGPADRARQPDRPEGDRRRRPRARRGLHRRAGARPQPADRLHDRSSPPSSPTSPRARWPRAALFLDLDYEARERVCLAGLAFSNPDRVVWEAAAAIPFTAFCAAGNVADATAKTAAGYAVMGHPGTAPNGYEDFSYGMKLNRGRTKTDPAMTAPGAEARRWPDRAGRRLHRRLGLRRLDRRLAAGRALPRRRAGRERARARARPALRPHRLPPVDGRRPPLRRLRADPGPGGADRRRQPGRRRLEPLPGRLAALAVGDLRAHGPPSRRRPAAADVAAGDQPQDARTATTPAPRRGLRVRQPSWDEVSKSGGVWAAMLREAGHTCDRVPVAIDFERCVDAKWCYTGCVFGAKNSLITNYLPSAERRGVEVRPLVQVERGRAVVGAPVPLDRPRRQGRPGDEAGHRAGRDRVQGRDPRRRRAGHAADPDALARQRRAARRSRPTSAATSGVNGDHVAAIEVDSRKAKRCSACRAATTSSTRASRSRR